MEWTVVTVIIALGGFIITVAKTILPLNASITRLATMVDILVRDMGALTDKNAESHRRLWEYNKTQDAKLDDHEGRIINIETKI